MYMSVPAMMEGDYDGKVCRLRKSLYGLREAPRIWYELLAKELKLIGLKAMTSAPCVFVGDDEMVLCYVDDLLLMSSSEIKLKKLKERLSSRLPANDLGEARDFLGMKLIREDDAISIVQSKYVTSILDDMRMSNCQGVTVPHDPAVDLSTDDGDDCDADFPYRSLIGSLLYIATHTRPDISVVVSMLASHVEAPKKKHQVGLIKLMKYLKSTSSYGLKLKPRSSTSLSAYVDANWAGERGSCRRSRTGIIIYYGNAVIHYSTSLQRCVTLSSTEAEFVAMSECTKLLLWLRRVLDELKIAQDVIPLYEDNAGAVTWATGHIAEDFRRSKHIELRYFHVRKQVRNKTIKVKKISTRYMRADFLTKPLHRSDLSIACKNAGIVSINGEEAC